MATVPIRSADYVPYVDGLRAVAILSVVGFHVGLPGFSGGFVGVDVFFVISGFLIIGHIRAALERGQFSLLEFYARRVLRLLPLLLTVILLSGAVAPLIFVTPDEYKDFGGAAEAAALMLSNHFFLAHQGYFDRAADTKVLLHTWSLGVEAQFYAVAPLVLAGLAATRRRMVFAVAWLVVTVLSLAGCILFTDAGRNAAFFLAIFRAWEFAAGAGAAALAAGLRARPHWIDASGLLGLIVIVACVIGYGPGLVYPSGWPVLPVIGAVLVIASGEASERAAVKRLLALPPLPGIGLVSYGWYLWHWPLITFNRIDHFGRHDLLSDALLGGGLGLALAIGTYFAIERPVARMRAAMRGGRRTATVILGLVCSLIAAVPGHLYAHTVANRLEAKLGPVLWPDKPNLRRVEDVCILRARMPLSADCLATPSAELGLLVGDSHAREAYGPLTLRARQFDVRLVTMVQNGCPPLFDADVLLQGQSQHCREGWQDGIDALETARAPLTFAVVVANWGLYLGGESNGRLPRMLAEPGAKIAARDQSAALEQALAKSIEKLRRLGVQRILVVAPEPQFLQDAPECLLRTARQHGKPDACTRPQAEIEAEHLQTLAHIEAAAGDGTDIRVIDPFAALCDGSRCWQHLDRLPLYIDDNHLSRLGMDLMYGRFAQELSWVFGRSMTGRR